MSLKTEEKAPTKKVRNNLVVAYSSHALNFLIWIRIALEYNLPNVTIHTSN